MIIPTHYKGNRLVEACGPLLSDVEMVRIMRHLPPTPTPDERSNASIAMHCLPLLEQIYVPSGPALNFAASMGVAVRRSYLHRAIGTPEGDLWLRGISTKSALVVPPAVLVLCGLSGMGKTQLAVRSAAQFPRTLTYHTDVPGYVSDVAQLIYIRIEVPPSGKLVDLARALMLATDEAMGTSIFSDDGGPTRPSAAKLFERWLSVAKRLAIGLIIFDEVQNLFQPQSKSERERVKGSRILRLVEEEALKAMLTISNTWQIPIAMIMTPDGMAAFSQRFAVAQRATTEGFHELRRPLLNDSYTRNHLLPTLMKYQYLPNSFTLQDDDVKELYRMTAFIPRVLVKLWRFSQRVALDYGDKSLRIVHFKKAMDDYLRPVKDAVQVLHSDNPTALRTYQDLVAPSAAWSG